MHGICRAVRNKRLNRLIRGFSGIAARYLSPALFVIHLSLRERYEGLRPCLLWVSNFTIFSLIPDSATLRGRRRPPYAGSRMPGFPAHSARELHRRWIFLNPIRVALKVLPAGMVADPITRERFEREVQAVAAP